MKKELLSGIKYLCYHGYFNWLPDEQYLKLLYFGSFGKKLNLTHPQTYNEKIQWLKLHDRKPEYSIMVDKCEAKKYIAERIGEEYVVPTYGVWDKFEDIEFDTLPDKFVLKCTHDSGGLVICRDKRQLDYQIAKKKITRSLNTNYYKTGREWPYKDVKPRIIAEKLLEDEKCGDIKDYKIYTFEGIAKALMINSGRQNGKTVADYYDIDFRKLDFTWGYPHSDEESEKPKNFTEMIKIAELISQRFPHLRVDFYEVNGKSYLG